MLSFTKKKHKHHIEPKTTNNSLMRPSDNQSSVPKRGMELYVPRNTDTRKIQLT